MIPKKTDDFYIDDLYNVKLIYPYRKEGKYI